MRELGDESAVEVHKPHEGLNLGDILRGRPTSNASNFDGIHFNMSFQEDKTQVLHREAFERAFLGLEVELMPLEYVQDSGHYHLMMFNCVCIYQDVIHIDCHIALINEVLKDVVHHCLESSRTVGEAEEHDKGFEEASICSKGSFPLITLLDLYVVISPAYIQLREVSGLRVRDLVDNIWYEGERVGILHRYHIKFLIILDEP